MPARPAPALGWTLFAAVLLAAILVPFALAGDWMDAWSVARLQALAERPAAVAALVVGLLAGDVLLPVPSSIVATLSGAALGTVGGTLATFVGMSAGCAVAYAIGRTAGAGAVARMVGDAEAVRLRALAERHGAWSLALTRAVPVLAEASTLLAGAAAMPLGRYVAVTSAANLGIAAVYAAVGTHAANVRSFLLALAAAVGLPLAGWLLVRLLPSVRTARPLAP
jgi:uncharacterized membrane protein YdjX (TVP38/TMEM64 family)